MVIKLETLTFFKTYIFFSSYLVLDCKSISYKYVLNFGYIAPYSPAPHLISFVPLNSFSFPFFLNYCYLCVCWCPGRAREVLGFPGAGVAGIPKQPNEVLEHRPQDRAESPLTARAIAAALRASSFCHQRGKRATSLFVFL